MKSEPKQTNKPEAPIYDEWVPVSASFGFALKMYESGGIVLEYKKYNRDARKFERSAAPIVLPWRAVEELRGRYHEIKALREKFAREAGGGESHG